MGHIEKLNADPMTERYLFRELIENPRNFWLYYLETTDAAAPSPTRQLADEMVRSGEVNDNTTLADAKEILDRHHAPQP